MSTVKFVDTRPTVKVELPSFPGSEVEIYKSLTVGEDRKIAAEFGNEATPDVLIAKVLKSVKKWNFTGDDDKPLSINKENLDRFPVNDLMAIVEAMTGEKIGKKKTD